MNCFNRAGKGLAGIGIAAVLLTASAANAEQKFLTLAAGGSAGSWYVGSAIISDIINNNVKETTLTPQPGGGVSNMKTLQSGKAEFAYMITSTVAEAVNGIGSFDKKYDGVRTVMALAPMYNHLVVRADSDIKSYEDLAGKRISPGKKGFTTAATFQAILKAMGSSEEKIEEAGGSVHWLDYSDAAQNMRDGLLDAVFSTSALPHSTYVELSTAFDIRIVPLSGDLAEKFIADNPGWAKGAIPGGRYPGVDDAVPTTVSYMGIATGKDVPDDVVYDFAKAVFEHRQKLADGYPAYRDIEPKTFVNESLNGLPMHPAAEKFWKEQGLM
ncbi:MAG: TAXI family TRAP transporter solute-binding subunit [Rhodospirillales bacterium]